jgi:hypothetical protein
MELSISLTRRLVIVRYLLQIGIEQSRKAEPLAGLAILPLHDSVELFLQTALEHCKGELRGSKDFLSYWAALEEKGVKLTHKEGMKRFNIARIAVKHYGTLPAHSNLEEFRVMISTFLSENCAAIFSEELRSMSLASLVRDEEVRDSIVTAEQCINNADYKSAIENASLAFRRSLSQYLRGGPGTDYRNRLFVPGQSYFSSLGFTFDPMFSEASRQMAKTIERMQEEFSEAIAVVAYNLDFDGYRYLKTFGPVIHELVGGSMQVEWVRGVEFDEDVVRRCLDFVTDAALRLEGVSHSERQ